MWSMFSTEEFAMIQFVDACDWLQVLFEASVITAQGRLRTRLLVLSESLSEWMDAARKDMRLKKEVRMVLRSRVRGMDPRSSASSAGGIPVRPCS